MTRLHTIVGVFAIAGAAAFAACSKSAPEPEKTAPGPAQTAQAPAHPAKDESPSGQPKGPSTEIAWEAPKAWQTVPNANTMRKATYKVPKEAGDAEDAELTVSAAAGGVEANIKRWSGQFANAEPKTELRTPNGLKVTVVEIKGTFAGGMGPMMGAPSTPKEKYMLLGAVVDGGDRQYFFKMTGPEKTVTAARKDFDALVSSFHPK